VAGNWPKLVDFGYFLSTLIFSLEKGSKSQGEFREFFEKNCGKTQDTRLKTKDQRAAKRLRKHKRGVIADDAD